MAGWLLFLFLRPEQPLLDMERWRDDACLLPLKSLHPSQTKKFGSYSLCIICSTTKSNAAASLQISQPARINKQQLKILRFLYNRCRIAMSKILVERPASSTQKTALSSNWKILQKTLKRRSDDSSTNPDSQQQIQPEKRMKKDLKPTLPSKYVPFVHIPLKVLKLILQIQNYTKEIFSTVPYFFVNDQDQEYRQKQCHDK